MIKLYKETGKLEDKKLDPEKLKAYREEHLDACLKEVGEAFGCSDVC